MSARSSPECRECEELEEAFKANPGGKRISTFGKIVVGVTAGGAVALSAICLPFVTPALRRHVLPFVPATDAQVRNVLVALRHDRTTTTTKNRLPTLLDIGSGDGRIVLDAAKAGYRAHGIELNPWLVLYSKLKARSRGLAAHATFSRQDLWKADLGRYDNVVIFGVEQMMPDLEKKLEAELFSRKNAQVAACRFPFPSWKPVKTVGEGIDSVWLYKKSSI